MAVVHTNARHCLRSVLTRQRARWKLSNRAIPGCRVRDAGCLKRKKNRAKRVFSFQLALALLISTAVFSIKQIVILLLKHTWAL